MMSPESPRRILVIGPSWVGDMVMAQTLFAELKHQCPEHSIDVLAPEWSRPILERMPEVRQALSLPFDHGELKLGDRRRLGRTLAGLYDQAIVLPNSLKSALVPFWGKIPVRTGWRGELRYGLLNDVRVLDKERYPLMVQRFVALALPADAPPPPRASIAAPQLSVDTSKADACMQSLGLKKNLPVLALCPGAEFGPSKRWPEAHYAQVAADWIAAGRQVWLFGSDRDRPVADWIREQIPANQQGRIQVLAGQTTLAEATDLLSLADLVVSNDSGLMHIAAALRRPLVAIYGSTSPAFTPPLHEQVEIVRLGLDCSPCFQRECPLGHLNCLRQLQPSLVQAAMNRLLPDEVPA